MGDGETYDTVAIQAVIDECALHPEGGVVTFEEDSRYLSAQIIVKNGVRLRIPKTTTLLAGLKVTPSQHPLPEHLTYAVPSRLLWISSLAGGC